MAERVSLVTLGVSDPVRVRRAAATIARDGGPTFWGGSSGVVVLPPRGGDPG